MFICISNQLVHVHSIPLVDNKTVYQMLLMSERLRECQPQLLAYVLKYINKRQRDVYDAASLTLRMYAIHCCSI